MDRNVIFEPNFDQKKNRKKKYFKFSFQYLENDPLNALNLIVDIFYG